MLSKTKGSGLIGPKVLKSAPCKAFVKPFPGGSVASRLAHAVQEIILDKSDFAYEKSSVFME